MKRIHQKFVISPLFVLFFKKINKKYLETIGSIIDKKRRNRIRNERFKSLT